MKRWISMLALLLAFSTTAYTQDSSRLTGLEKTVAGDTLRLLYNPAGGPLAGKADIGAMIYLYRNYRWYVDDIVLQQRGATWNGQYAVPANCAFVAIKFVTTENGMVAASDNNNDHGFMSVTTDKNGNRLPGGQLAWGIFRKPSVAKAPFYFNNYDISNEALEMWVRKEMEAYPDSMPKFFDSYLAMLKLKLGDEFPQRAPRNLEKFLRIPGLDEQGYNIVYETYRFQLKDQQKADSVRKLQLQRFPKGRAARFDAYSKAYMGQMGEAQFAAMETFLRDFPVAEYRRDTIASQQFIYHNIYRLLGQVYIATGRTDSLKKHLRDMDFVTLNEIYRANLDKAFIIGKTPLAKIYPFSKMLIDDIIKKSDDGSYMEDTRYTPLQARENARTQMDARLAIHISMLNKMGKYKEALPYGAQRSGKGRYNNANLNEAWVNILEHTGGEKKVKTVLEAGVKAGAATPVMMEKLKRIYGKTTGFDAYVAGLKPAVDSNEIKAKLIREKITPFRLKDMNGSTVSSDSWNNKIIVLDYWATWCFPCKMAFPGMQMAVSKYAADPSVDFYFIATMERAKTYKEDISKYIRSSGYSFKVLYDDENPDTKGNDRVFKSMLPVFHSSAIPRKVVLKNGIIRYTAEGYGGSPSALADELSQVIEILKAEQ